MTSAWLAFWNGSHPIYVNARHKDVHYRLIAKAIAALVPRPDARVLDYGCGEALHADAVAARLNLLDRRGQLDLKLLRAHQRRPHPRGRHRGERHRVAPVPRPNPFGRTSPHDDA